MSRHQSTSAFRRIRCWIWLRLLLLRCSSVTLMPSSLRFQCSRRRRFRSWSRIRWAFIARSSRRCHSIGSSRSHDFLRLILRDHLQILNRQFRTCWCCIYRRNAGRTLVILDFIDVLLLDIHARNMEPLLTLLALNVQVIRIQWSVANASTFPFLERGIQFLLQRVELRSIMSYFTHARPNPNKQTNLNKMIP